MGVVIAAAQFAHDAFGLLKPPYWVVCSAEVPDRVIATDLAGSVVVGGNNGLIYVIHTTGSPPTPPELPGRVASAGRAV